MPLSDRVLETDSLAQGTDYLYLTVGLPWFRAVPRSAVESLEVSLDGVTVEIRQLNGLVAADFFDHRQEWFPQDRVSLQLSAQAATGSGHNVKVSFRVAVPNLVTPEGQAVVIPSYVEKQLIVKSN